MSGTRTPVRAVVELWRFGSSPEQIQARLPHLTLAHQAEINGYIERNRVPGDPVNPA